jgi:predicted GNAT family acetyltransferase
MAEFDHLKIETYQNAGEFLSQVGDDLLSDEIRHGLIYGVAQKIAQDPNIYSNDRPWFLAIKNQGEIWAAAMRTPPYRPILAHLRGAFSEVSTALVQAIHAQDPAIPGVIGDREIAEPFTQKWCQSFGFEILEEVAQRIYQLTELVVPRYAQGYLRPANLDDQEIVLRWIAAFSQEALGATLNDHLLQRYRQRILDGDIFLWEDDGPLSLAGQSRPTHRGISIAPVYTPPEYRNHGYATSCVAALCERLLTHYEFCTLYTDLSNPTSNSIYMQIGFKKYCDSVQYTYSQAKLSD